MIYRGQIQDGVAVFPAGCNLPDGTRVVVAVDRLATSFWDEKSLASLAHEQAIPPIQRADELAMDWPSEDAVDDLLTMLREVRS
jgi:hypothetical protein